MVDRCSEMVWDSSGWHKYQCSKKVVVEREGKAYCKIHDPEYVEIKNKERQAKYEAKCCRQCRAELKDYWAYCPFCGTKKLK